MRKNFFQLCVLFLLLCLQTKSFSGGGEGHGGGVDPIFLFRFNAHKLNRFLKNIEKQSWEKVQPESYDFIKTNQLSLQKQLKNLSLVTLAKETRATVRTHEEAVEFLMGHLLSSYSLTPHQKGSITQDVCFLMLFEERKGPKFIFLGSPKSHGPLSFDERSSLTPSPEQLSLFEQAKEQLIKTLSAETSGEKPEGVEEDTWNWLLIHRIQMAKDLSKTQFEFLSPWNKRAPETCASTVMEPGATIVFNLEICKRSLITFDEFQKVLVHETTHHLGVEDENIADEIARSALLLNLN